MMSWQQALRQNFTSLKALADFLDLDQDQRDLLLQDPKFVWNVPLRLARKMKKGSVADPLFLQFAALKQELIVAEGFKEDPVQDSCFQKTSRLLQKYRSRALLVSTSACAMHCRFCFRQSYPYESGPKDFDEELALLAEDESIDEIILSGGDPLSLSHRVLQDLIHRLEAIPHLKRLRFHTRFPIGIPERIDAEFLQMIENCRFSIWFVLHVNHPLELDADVLQAMGDLRKRGVTVLSQTVLLKDVNDQEQVLEELFRKLVNQGIMPYYLHQLDRVQGAAHFEVSVERGLELIRYLEGVLPGYGVPKYVQEVPFAQSKTNLISY
jgi:EF-P beta-lysylation protein EpmB